jgi:hypothetical protein
VVTFKSCIGDQASELRILLSICLFVLPGNDALGPDARECYWGRSMEVRSLRNFCAGEDRIPLRILALPEQLSFTHTTEPVPTP